ncbi:GGDEF domain-containing protein [Schlesneria paludicola]|uniref:GGDEF domain-containing protein n=1 Tax=Schlesneria paludicola TaxID=360056 RepID=UPI00029A676F|nr:GGDEF domain-containing protein [Schlesneria paludicola]
MTDPLVPNQVMRSKCVQWPCVSVGYGALWGVFALLWETRYASDGLMREFWGLILVATVVAAWWGSLRELLAISFIGAVVCCGLDSSSSENCWLIVATHIWWLSVSTALMLLSARARRELDAARASARVDVLTSLSNRRAILEILEAELERTRRSSRSFALALLDCDGFKAINDQQGHLAGDMALQRIAAALRAQTRTYDAVGRLGGDEFVLVLSGTEFDEIPLIFERLRSSLRIELAQTYPTLTFSLGVVTIRATDLLECPTLDPTECLRQADEAMYAAKRAGQDQSCFRVLNGMT